LSQNEDDQLLDQTLTEYVETSTLGEYDTKQRWWNH
ncbi:unnamed protein product, partial [Didymodactylos carnosus]